MGVPKKWMVDKGNSTKMDDLGVAQFMETTLSIFGYPWEDLQCQATRAPLPT